MQETTCCFFGHRNAELSKEEREKLFGIIETLIVRENVDTFLFGSKSKFDRLCYETVCELQKIYPHIRRIYVSIYPTYPDEESGFFPRGYEETYYPDGIRNAGRATYVKRNYEMIDKSKFCVVYFDEIYKPKSQRKNIYLPEVQPKSGTRVAYGYACKKKREIINVLEEKMVI